MFQNNKTKKCLQISYKFLIILNRNFFFSCLFIGSEPQGTRQKSDSSSASQSIRQKTQKKVLIFTVSQIYINGYQVKKTQNT
jgi:hypothetical protein